jgi:hypothetical protein
MSYPLLTATPDRQLDDRDGSPARELPLTEVRVPVWFNSDQLDQQFFVEWEVPQAV